MSNFTMKTNELAEALEAAEAHIHKLDWVAKASLSSAKIYEGGEWSLGYIITNTSGQRSILNLYVVGKTQMIKDKRIFPLD